MWGQREEQTVALSMTNPNAVPHAIESAPFPLSPLCSPAGLCNKLHDTPG
jgi:hypothetical protein